MITPDLDNYSTRCLISHRPAFMGDEPLFYRCPVCGELIVANSDGLHQHDQRRPGIVCCGQALAPLEVCRDPALLDSHKMKFIIFGGYESNAVRVEVEDGFHPMDQDHRIEWMYIRTFQGGQLKRLLPRTRSFTNFSFADYDAFVYCDRTLCRMGWEHCQFECKRGMMVYAYCSQHGLFRMVMEGKG